MVLPEEAVFIFFSPRRVAVFILISESISLSRFSWLEEGLAPNVTEAVSMTGPDVKKGTLVQMSGP